MIEIDVALSVTDGEVGVVWREGESCDGSGFFGCWRGWKKGREGIKIDQSEVSSFKAKASSRKEGSRKRVSSHDADSQIDSFPYHPFASPPNAQVPTQPLSVPTHISPPTTSITGFPSISLLSSCPPAPAPKPIAASLAADVAPLLGFGNRKVDIRLREV